MKVAKFGGTSLADAKQFRKVRELIVSDPQRRIIVVSAPGKRSREDVKITDLLIQCACLRLSGRDAGGEVSRVIARYQAIAEELELPPELAKAFRMDLCFRLERDMAHRKRFEDAVKAAGEAYCAQLMTAFLRHTGVDAEYVSPEEAGLIVSEEYGSAQVLEESYSRLALLRDSKRIIVFPGFFGHSRDGHIVTFTRGGSDLTGAILAAAVQAEAYENFTDVNGVAAADPRIVKNPVSIATLTYQELRELSYGGFSVFHDEAMLPVLEAAIPIHILNTNQPRASRNMGQPLRGRRSRPRHRSRLRRRVLRDRRGQVPDEPRKRIRAKTAPRSSRRKTSRSITPRREWTASRSCCGRAS